MGLVEMKSDRPLALAITGASGAPYWVRLLEILLKAEANVNAAMMDGATALSVAKESGHDEIVRILSNWDR